MQAPVDQSGLELRLAIVAIAELVEIDGGDHDGRRVAPEVLVEANVKELVAKIAAANRRVELGPAIQPRLETFNRVNGEEVGQPTAAERGGKRPLQRGAAGRARRIHDPR